MARLSELETDWENVFAMLLLAAICLYSMHLAKTVDGYVVPRVVDTITGGFIGYIVKSQKIKNQGLPGV